MVWDEAKLLVDQTNAVLATLGVVIQSATMTTGMGGGREAQKHFRELISGLYGE